MSESIDRSPPLVPVAEFWYRHEAEFAAGFLHDAGIPYRLQADDSGGMEVGITIGRPAVLWVRAVDVPRARELLAEDVEDAAPPDLVQGEAPVTGGEVAAIADPRTRRVPGAVGPGTRDRGPRPLTGVQRVLAGVCAAAAAAGAFAVPTGSLWLPVLAVVSLVFAGVAAIGRGPGPIEELLRAVSGEAPK